MPRQRKAQNGAVRTPMSTGRVANTTTSTPKLQTVYRIPTRGAYGECEKLAYEVLGESPINVRIEGENIYRISFDDAGLKSTIENFDNLDLKNVTADSVSTPSATVESLSAGSASVSGDASVTGTVTAGSVSASTGDITTLTSNTATTETLSVTDSASVTNNLTVGGTATIADLHMTDVEVTGNLIVDGTSTFVGAVDAANASVENLTVETTASITGLTANGATVVDGDLSVTGNTTLVNATVSNELNVSGDLNITDDLNVSGTTTLAALETTSSVDIGGTLRTTGAAVIGNGLNVTGQMESDTVRTGEVIADEVRVTDGLYLSAGAEAPDFVLQAEKGVANGVCPLDGNAKVDTQYLPPIYTSAIVKIGTGLFSNSNTSTVVDADITGDSFVAISNYQDIIGDLTETISTGQLTVISNQTETGSYKYIVVNPLTACNS